MVSLTFMLLPYIFYGDTHPHQIIFNVSGLIYDKRYDNPNDLLSLKFSAIAYEEAKREENRREQLYNLTAILLHWKRRRGLRKTVRFLLHTGFFKQIIIWNNNPNISLTSKYFINDNNNMKKFIRVINSKRNIKDEAKYRACVRAKTRACFYVDDDWDVSLYVRSLIASFRSDPYLLHTVTDPYTYYTNLVWSYFDKDIDLHSGFSWIGCGSVFLRQHAEKHLQLVHKYLKNQTGLHSFSDVFFSIWLNNIPVQLNTNIQQHSLEFFNESTSFSSTSQFGHFQFKSSITAIRILEHSLRFSSSETSDTITFSRQQNRRFPYYVKSPSLNDDFIFYTNLLPFQLQNIPFEISEDSERGTRSNLPDGPNVQYFTSHTTWHAVDGDLSTCWYTNTEIGLNDFFAIDFLSIQTNIMFTLAVSHSPRLRKKLDVRISFDGIRWSSYRSLNGIYTKKNRTLEQHLHTYLYDSSEFNIGFNSFRYITFTAMKESDHRFEVCEISTISNRDSTSIKSNFRPLKQ